MEKKSWVVHVSATCDTCGKQFEQYKNGQALAAQHAKKYGHVVRGEIGIAFVYDGKK